MNEASAPAHVIDLDAYRARIGDRGPLAPTLEVLARLTSAHVAAIPFENLDVRLGRPIALELPALEAKLVRARRGGYCFEQNALFAAVLRTIGFEVTTLEARVQPAGLVVRPRTHMILRVDVEGAAHLVDVGFGGDGTRLPLRLDGRPSDQGVATYWVAKDADRLVLRASRGSLTEDEYVFTLEPAHPVDYEMANHYTSTYPASRFVQTLTAQRSLPDARHVLRNRTYTTRTAAGEATRELEDLEVAEVIRKTIGLDVSEADVLRALPPR